MCGENERMWHKGSFLSIFFIESLQIYTTNLRMIKVTLLKILLD